MPSSWSSKRERQYQHIKKSEKGEGRSAASAKRIAAATVNKTRRKKGETKGSSRTRAKTRTGAKRRRSTAKPRTARKTTGRTATRKRAHK